MADVLGIMVLTVLLAGIAVVMYLRESAPERSRFEARVRASQPHTVAYAVPDGVDPAEFRVGLNRAGFISRVGRVGTAECALVECLTTERAGVRGVLEAAHANADHEAGLKLQHVVFEDER